MNLKRDPATGALYLRFREGAVGHNDPDMLPEGLVEDSIELAEGAYLDTDGEGMVIGIEFESLADFEDFLSKYPKGFDIPDRIGESCSVPPLPGILAAREER